MRATKAEIQEKRGREILDKLICVALSVGRWSGYADVKDEKKKGGFTRFQFCPPEELGFFSRIHNRVVDMWLARVGIKKMENWFIPESLMDATHHYFCKMEKEYQGCVEEFMSKYMVHIRAWQQKNPKYAYMVEHPSYSEENMRKKFRFKWFFSKMSPAPGYILRQDFFDEIESMEQTLYEELAKTAEMLWNTVYVDRVRIVSRTVGPLKHMKAKLEGLIFLSPIISSTLRIINAGIVDLPHVLSNKAMTPQTIETMRRLIWILKDVDRCHAASQAADAGQPVLTILNEVDLEPGPALLAKPDKSAKTIRAQRGSVSHAVQLQKN